MSRQVAEYYRERRGIPPAQVCSISAPKDEDIDRGEFEKAIRRPLLDFLSKQGLQDRILYIVLTKGVPLRIQRDDHNAGQASVDSELTLLYQDLAGVPRVPASKRVNPYFAHSQSGEFTRFSHRNFPMYLVTRLDGYDFADIRGLIDRAQVPSTDGQFILDLIGDENNAGNNWLREAAERLKAAGMPASRIRLEKSYAFLTGQQRVLGYASWGSNDHANHSRFLRNTWVNGALLTEFVSSDARTFKRPPKKWDIGKWDDPPITFFAGSPQSLLGDDIHEGVTGAAGNAYEPFLDACVRPQILFPSYVRGLNLAESYYAALPYLGWQSVIVGDPLTAPFPGTLLPPEEANPPKDPSSGLPQYLARWLAKLRPRTP